MYVVLHTLLTVPSNHSRFQKDVSLANDDLLGDLMEELHQGPSEGMMKPLPIKLKKKGFCATKSVFLFFLDEIP